MNSNLAEVGKPTRWPPGQSGNLAGTNHQTLGQHFLSFIHDFALVWLKRA
jgi:hypothetical protein